MKMKLSGWRPSFLCQLGGVWKRACIFCLSFGCFLLVRAAASEAVPVTWVVPGTFAEVDAGGGATPLSSVVRQHTVYGASLFPAGPMRIEEIRFRPSRIYGRAFTAHVDNLHVKLSTTQVGPDALSRTFAANVGPDETVVFQGGIDLSSAFVGPAAGPKEFDIRVPFGTVFAYDPAAGNLLVEIVNFSGAPLQIATDASPSGSDRASRMFALDAQATSGAGTDTGADIMQLVYRTAEDLAPSISMQPEGGTALKGSSVTLGVVAWGTAPLHYQWRLDGAVLEGQTNSSLVLSQVQPNQAGTYTVVVSNSVGSVESQGAALVVLDALGLVVPEGVAQTEAGGGATPLSSVNRQQAVYGASLFPGSSIQIEELRFRPSAVYGRAFTTRVDSLVVKLSTTRAAPDNLSRTFASNVGPDERVVFEGPIDLSSSFRGPAGGPKDFDISVPFTVPFVYDPAAGNLLLEIVNPGGAPIQIANDASSSASDQASRIIALDGNAAQAGGSDTGGDVIQIVYTEPKDVPPTITVHPRSQTVFMGSTVTLTVAAWGTPPLQYQWRVNGADLEGQTNTTLVLPQVQLSQMGSYVVVVSNSWGIAESAASELTILHVLGLIVPEGVAQTDAGGGATPLSSVVRQQTVYGASLFLPDTIRIQEIRFRPSRVYGAAFSTRVDDLQVKLSTTQARADGLNRTFAENVGADETVVFQGAIDLSSGFVGPSTGPKEFDISIPFTVPFVYDPAVGNLLIEIVNLRGAPAQIANDATPSSADQGSRAFALSGQATVATSVDTGADIVQILYQRAEHSPPQIVAQPRGGVLLKGSTVTMTVVAGGTAPLTYQWHLDGVALAGQTSPNLVLTAVQPAQAGVYTVQVSNALGSVESQGANLVVLDALGLIVPEGFDQREAGGGATPLSSVVRQQTVYAASMFPPYPIRISALQFRPSAIYGRPFHTQVDELQIGLCTTRSNPDQLQAVFDNNLGPDDTVAFHGSILLSTEFRGPAAGPKDFDITIPLTTPFTYDPSLGNLLVEIRNPSGSLVQIASDASSSSGDSASRIFSLDAEAATATSRDTGADIMRILHQIAPGVAPMFLSQPQSQEIRPGGTVTFQSGVIGTAPLVYQWLFNNSPLEGETDTVLTLAGVQQAQAGFYALCVSNTVTSVTSAPAALVIVGLPQCQPTSLRSGFLVARGWGRERHGGCASWVSAGRAGVWGRAGGRGLFFRWRG